MPTDPTDADYHAGRPAGTSTAGIEAGLSLGGNLGDRIANLRGAVARIAVLPATTLLACSPIYETAPVGVKPEYSHLAYLNAVVIIRTALAIRDLSGRLHAIEAAMGRIRTSDRFAPRPIDIDILYAGGHVSDEADLTLPHPRWAARRFVLQPLADVRPGLVFPGTRETVAEVLRRLPGDDGITRLPDTLGGRARPATAAGTRNR